jgi:two-component system sensor histidine kinase MprB
MRAQVDETLNSETFASSGVMQNQMGFSPERLCQVTSDLPGELRPGNGSIQIVRSDGTICASRGAARLPVTAQDIAVASGGQGVPARGAVNSLGVQVRVVTHPIADGYAVMVSRDLSEMKNTLNTLSWALLLAGGLGALGALTAGWIVARAGLRPVNELTRAAEHVAATQDFDVPISVTGHDEVARLAEAFNKMTTALEAGRERRRQLIADAGHELRTPLTSLRTNIELLLRSEDAARPLPSTDRRELLNSVSAQLQELSHLTNELSLLSDDEPAVEVVYLRLDDVVRRAVQRASQRGSHSISTELDASQIWGNPGALERAVLNLLDNAIKFSPPGSTVQVRLHNGLIEVADQGPGIPEAERPQAFQRFWRAPSARALPGSGLGLAIVADVVASHGGQVSIGTAGTGGAVIAM